MQQVFDIRSGRNQRQLVMLLIAGGLVLGTIDAAVAADSSRMYRWTDREGNVHYSDQPSQNSVEVNPRVASPTDSVSASAKVDAEDCERRRKEADSYRNAGKVTETNSLGETREYSDAERAKLVERADNIARTACGEAAAPSRSEK